MITCNKCGGPIAADDHGTNWTLMCNGCHMDHLEYLKIKTKDGKIQPLKLTRLQRLIWEAYAMAIKRGKSVNLEIVKRGRMR